MTKKIFLSTGGITLVSDEDFIYLAGFTWCQDNWGYVQGHINVKTQQMSRIIAKRMGLNLTNFIDHIDRNKLNNCRNNLRAATNSQNTANSKGFSKHGLKGIFLDKNRWRACITVNGKKIYLGYFETPEDAHEAYCEAAIKYFGEYANFGA